MLFEWFDLTSNKNLNKFNLLTTSIDTLALLFLKNMSLIQKKNLLIFLFSFAFPLLSLKKFSLKVLMINFLHSSIFINMLESKRNLILLDNCLLNTWSIFKEQKHDVLMVGYNFELKLKWIKTTNVVYYHTIKMKQIETFNQMKW